MSKDVYEALRIISELWVRGGGTEKRAHAKTLVSMQVF